MNLGRRKPTPPNALPKALPPTRPENRRVIRHMEVEANRRVAERQFRATMPLSLAALALVVALNFGDNSNLTFLIALGAAMLCLAVVLWELIGRGRSARLEAEAKRALIDLEEDEEAKAAVGSADPIDAGISQAGEARASAALSSPRPNSDHSVLSESDQGAATLLPGTHTQEHVVADPAQDTSFDSERD